MRLLKRKIGRTLQAPIKRDAEPKPESDEEFESKEEIKIIKKKIEKKQKPRKKRKRIGGSGTPSEKTKATKHIVKNYGKAMVSFAISDLSRSYLDPMLQEESITVDEFNEYVGKKKDSIEGIESLRNMLVVTPEDSPKEASLKKVFQKIATVFIKYFSVNWIYSGKLKYRQVHLKYRFKMLRRVKNPNLFTYLMSGKI